MENKANSSGFGQSSDSNAGQAQNSGLNMGNLTDMLGNLNIPESLKKYSGTATKVFSKLTTTQKVVGGALLLLGAGYLTSRGKGGFNLMGGKKKR